MVTALPEERPDLENTKKKKKKKKKKCILLTGE